MAKRVIPHESARRATKEESQKKKETASKGKVNQNGVGEKGCGKLTGRTSRRLEAGPAGGGKARKHPSNWKKVNIIDQDGYDLIIRLRRLGQYARENFRGGRQRVGRQRRHGVAEAMGG